MKHVGLFAMCFAVALLCALSPARAQNSHQSEAFFAEVTPRGGTPGIYDLVVPLEVMDKSKEDLADLRLRSADGREIPYALRIRREVDEKIEVGARLFNQALIDPKAAEVSLDLGEKAGEHNAVEIETSGANFRRRVEIDGSDTGRDWRMLKTGEVIFDFQAENKSVESKLVSYPASRYRYLRVRVSADELTDKQAPSVTGVKVLMGVREAGELTTWSVPLGLFQLTRNQQAPASTWLIDLGARVPCDRLTLDVADESFSRSFQIEGIDDYQNPRFIAAGELTRRIGEDPKPLIVRFEKEVYVRKLRLLVTDYSNSPLAIKSIKPAAPARELVFELKEAGTQPLRLYFGNPKEIAPHYDFEKELTTKLVAQPVRCEVASVTENPDYVPEPIPLTERIPWLIYVVLTVSSLALAIILVNLARGALRTTLPPDQEAGAQGSGGV